MVLAQVVMTIFRERLQAVVLALVDVLARVLATVIGAKTQTNGLAQVQVRATVMEVQVDVIAQASLIAVTVEAQADVLEQVLWTVLAANLQVIYHPRCGSPSWLVRAWLGPDQEVDSPGGVWGRPGRA